jgi:hypothetical protein
VAIVSIKPQVAGRIIDLSRGTAGDVVDAVAGEVRRAIRGRGEEELANLLPKPQTSAKKQRILWPLISLAAVVLSGVIIGQVMKDSNYAAVAAAVTGLTVFAGIYAAAQALERFLEPLSHWFLSTQDDENSYAEAVAAADTAVAAWMADPSDATKDAAEKAMEAMAKAKTKIDELKDDRAAAYWGIATIAGMLVSGFFHLYLLKLIGVTTTHGWDVVATGLIIGSGTKPLHDLISKITKSSTDSESGGATTTAKST